MPLTVLESVKKATESSCNVPILLELLKKNRATVLVMTSTQRDLYFKELGWKPGSHKGSIITVYELSTGNYKAFSKNRADPNSLSRKPIIVDNSVIGWM